MRAHKKSGTLILPYHNCTTMERKQRRRTSAETRFEFNACLSVFKQSRVSFSSINQQELPEILCGVTQKVAFTYDQNLSLAFESNTASDVPQVHELFGGVIGCYRYVVTSPSLQDGPRSLSETRPRLLSHADDSYSPEQKPIEEEKNVNSDTVLHTVPEPSESNENQFEFDWSEVEAILDQCDDLWPGYTWKLLVKFKMCIPSFFEFAIEVKRINQK